MVRQSKDIDHIDKHIGEKIYTLRLARGLSREQLSTQIGVSQQQCQKYELGSNRISAGRLALVAQALDYPIDYFYAGLDKDTASVNTYHQRMCIELSRNFMNIKKPVHQEAVNILAKILASEV